MQSCWCSSMRGGWPFLSHWDSWNIHTHSRKQWFWAVSSTEEIPCQCQCFQPIHIYCTSYCSLSWLWSFWLSTHEIKINGRQTKWLPPTTIPRFDQSIWYVPRVRSCCLNHQRYVMGQGRDMPVSSPWKFNRSFVWSTSWRITVSKTFSTVCQNSSSSKTTG